MDYTWKYMYEVYATKWKQSEKNHSSQTGSTWILLKGHEAKVGWEQQVYSIFEFNWCIQVMLSKYTSE